jgi:hypothetical protein
MMIARRHQLWELAFEAAGFLVDQNWSIEESPQYHRNLVEAILIRGTCLIQLLDVANVTKVAPNPVASNINVGPAQLHAYHKLITDVFFSAMKIAAKISDVSLRDTLVYNIAVHVYNYFIMVAPKEAIETWIAVLQPLYESLVAIPTYTNSDLFVSVCEAFARSIYANCSAQGIVGSANAKKSSTKSAPKSAGKNQVEDVISLEMLEKGVPIV